MAQSPRLAAFSRICGMIWFSIGLHWEALKDALRQDGLGALLHVQQIRDAAMAKLFCTTSSGFIAFEDTTVVPSLVQAASGVVLELGPGSGNQLHRFDMSRVSYVYGVEPNLCYENEINAKLDKHNIRDKYKLVAANIEDSDKLRSVGISEGSLDSVLSIQVLCAVQDPKSVMKEVWKLLKPGGKFIFWEHGWSKSRLTMAEQAILNPGWSTFVGCRLNRDVLADILDAGEWENPDEIEAPEDLVSCLPRIQGVLVKKA
ncbi:hypothetical protein PFICI_09129 [Pestalotiopsis fici W106-1]|uniref:Methyltransferase type 11 domain-containing protein n=1 Tax=Pestalotiopsis fici (strain W106-1 / CGMCC3.15140) TaxID=1229662 RepID=W3X296_PESFW|nr:uncharacterized protein PFICI_09129 [Pestalotiopsis fici W106-1]ETS79276.1 hypothetical protein PFICI_09129 [Pestalotiopsis fici W106-1]